MEALYWYPPTEKELAGTVYVIEDFPEPEVKVWREVWEAIQLYRSFSTQWRFGMNGPVALDYNVFQHALDRKGIVGDKYERIMSALAVIESAALIEINKP